MAQAIAITANDTAAPRAIMALRITRCIIAADQLVEAIHTLIIDRHSIAIGIAQRPRAAAKALRADRGPHSNALVNKVADMGRQLLAAIRETALAQAHVARALAAQCLLQPLGAGVGSAVVDLLDPVLADVDSVLQVSAHAAPETVSGAALAPAAQAAVSTDRPQ